MNKNVLLIGVVLFLCIVFVRTLKSPSDPTRQTRYQSITIGKQRLNVEIVDTPQTITKGLGGRDRIGSDGMLFVLPTRVIPSFWMKDMRFDLDFVWISEGKVVDLTLHVNAQLGASDRDLKIYSPKSSVTHVLEMASGEVSKRRIRIGDSVQM